MREGLYIVATEPAVGYLQMAQCCVKMEVPMLQLRDKRMDDRQLLETARAMREITRDSKTALVINDRADIATLCDADYLHVGLTDISISDARRIVGDMKIGISAETLEEAQSIDYTDVDYVGAGPIFTTPTKTVAVPPLGIDGLTTLASSVPVPVVAIGGIFPSNLPLIKSSGAKGWAMVRQFAEARTADELCRAIAECL